MIVPSNGDMKAYNILENSGMLASEKIKARIRDADAPYKANDNISDYIGSGIELAALVNEVEAAFEKVLDVLIIDQVNDPNSRGTARRLAKMYIKELMHGRYHAKPAATAFPNESYTGMLVIRAELKSVCSHHHQPVTGVAYIGVIPYKKVMGLSKYVRIAQWCARRGTLQEELCQDIAKEIIDATESMNVAVHIGAEHGCCTNRGVMAHSSLTQTTVLKGVFHEADVKKEFFDSIALQKAGGGGVY
jgi:GTP cyclohydrolase I